MRGTWITSVLLAGLYSGCSDESARDQGRDAAASTHRAITQHTAMMDGGAGSLRDAGDAMLGKEREGLVSEFLADAGDGWVSLAQAHWVLPPDTESYRCARVTITRDVALSALHPVTPLGTHHDTVMLAPNPTVPDGFSACDGATIEPVALGGAGVGTNDFVLPKGVAIRLHRGEQLLLSLHLFNTSDQPLEGTSGILARTLPLDQVEHEAEEVLVGPLSLDIPAGERGVVQSGRCRVTHDSTVFAVAPHAHMLATHVKVVAESSIDGMVVLRDAPYSFDSQVGDVIESVRMKEGDMLGVSCIYDNLTDHAVHYGNSSLDEMCFAVIWRYPRVQDSSSFLCVQ